MEKRKGGNYKQENRWMDNKDFFDDLYAVADFGQPHRIPTVSQPSADVKKVRTKACIYEDVPDLSVERQRGGRGRANLWRNNLDITPGGTPSFLQQQSETSKEIRATRGFGYCNDQIEHNLFKGDSDSLNVRPMDAIRFNNSSPTESLKSSTHSSSFSPNHSSSPEMSRVSSKVPQVALCDIVQRSRNDNTLKVGDASNLFNHQVDNYINIKSFKEFPKL